jgi:hypothetical protein
MIKTQIQVPEEQYKALRKFAAEREWSMAETFRRGAELLLEIYPQGIAPRPQTWKFPSSDKVGWRGLSASALKDAVWNDSEPELGAKR